MGLTGCFRGHSKGFWNLRVPISKVPSALPPLLIFRQCRSLKSLYLLMVTVGELLLGLNRCEKRPSFILEGSRHPASSSPSRNLSFSEKNVIFDENLWFFEKNFELKIFLGKFYIMFTQPILGTSSYFKIGVSLAIHSSYNLNQFGFILICFC